MSHTRYITKTNAFGKTITYDLCGKRVPDEDIKGNTKRINKYESRRQKIAEDDSDDEKFTKLNKKIDSQEKTISKLNKKIDEQTKMLEKLSKLSDIIEFAPGSEFVEIEHQKTMAKIAEIEKEKGKIS